MASNNTYTNMQLRTWIENAIKKSKTPDPREQLKQERQKKSAKVAQKYGF